MTAALTKSLEELADTASSIADHMVAARKLNRLYSTALLLIRESPETNQAAKMLAAAALDDTP